MDCSTPGFPVHHQLPELPQTRPLSRWCHPTISSSVVPLSSHLQFFPASGSFSSESALHIKWPKYWHFSFSISPSNEQDWSPLGWTGWISLQSKGLSSVFSNNTVQKHQFFGAQLSYSPTVAIAISFFMKCKQSKISLCMCTKSSLSIHFMEI